MATTSTRLAAAQVRRRCDPATLGFPDTRELPAPEGVIGQERAVQAVRFGMGVTHPGYHIFAMGPTGTGKTATIRHFIESEARSRPTPDDWCYVHNFIDPSRPRAVRLPPGRGRQLRADMEQLVEELPTRIPRAFESEMYQRERGEVEAEVQRRQRETMGELEREAGERNFAMVETPQGVMLAPTVAGEPLSPEQIAKLDDETRKQIETRERELREKARSVNQVVRTIEKEAKTRLRELDRGVVAREIDELLADLREKYADIDGLAAHFGAIREDILKNMNALKQVGQSEPAGMAAFFTGPRERPSFERYLISLIVDNTDVHGAPVVFESNPSYYNLIGHVEFEPQFGMLITNLTMLRGGALHRANGGYLMLQARELLMKPFAWPGLKRALCERRVHIEFMGQEFQAVATRTLEPEPIPLDVKLVLIGDPMIFYTLLGGDEDFREQFRVRAEFNVDMEWNADAQRDYARFIAHTARRRNLRPFSAGGVARLLEESARMAGDQEKLSTRFGDFVDMVQQADYWASQAGHAEVMAGDVARAVEEQVYRVSLTRDRIRDFIAKGMILIDTHGSVVGQVNGLSVYGFGDFAFGKPSRITARTSIGSAGVVAIDREAKLDGRIHSKGVFTLSGFLNGKFGTDFPLALSASLGFEQLYEEVEGDSASSAELYALLSSLSGVPIRQDLAVTGSVNQLGQVQAIGGVNEKIEGFYDVCGILGATGTQGVVIPRSNARNLMLRDDVVEAIAAGRFQIHAVDSIDAGIELLTGVPAGERRADGSYPPDSIYGKVMERLSGMAEKARAYSPQKRRHPRAYRKRRGLPAAAARPAARKRAEG